MQLNQTDFIRPIRIPERVPLGVAQPPTATAGEAGSWMLEFILAEAIPPGGSFFAQISGGRNQRIAWPGIQIENEQEPGYVWMETSSGEILGPVRKHDTWPVIEFRAPELGLPEGDVLTLHLGRPSGTTAPRMALTNMFFVLLKPAEHGDMASVTLFGDELDRIVGACMIHVVGGDLHRLKAFAPSIVRPGEEFRILIRPEDRHGNTSPEEPGPLRALLNGNEVATRRVLIQHSTCSYLSGLALPEEGVYRIEIEDAERGLRATTNPILCRKDAAERYLWGMIHCHTEISDGSGSLDHAYRYMRDECGLDFGATSDHDHLAETSDEMWRAVQEAAARYHEPGKFTTFLGYEWAEWRQNGDGDRNVYYLRDRRPMYRSDDGCYETPNDLFRALVDETAIIIPHHPATLRNHCDWKDHDPERERLVEIYSAWGSSERALRQGNPFPIKGSDPEERDHEETPDGFVQRALELGWRVGFTGGGDDHQGHPGDETLHGDRPFAYKPGLMAVWAKENTREAVWDGMWNRRVVATTGARIIVEFHLNGFEIGSIVDLEKHPELEIERTITITVHGTERIQSVEIVRNNEDVKRFEPDAPDCEISWTDRDPLGQINLPPNRFSDQAFTFYYLRIIQEDGEMAWASPIWIVSPA